MQKAEKVKWIIREEKTGSSVEGGRCTSVWCIRTNHTQNKEQFHLAFDGFVIYTLSIQTIFS